MDHVRLEDLLNRHVDCALTDGERRELEQMLLDSPDARGAFWRFVRLHSLIRENFQSQAGRRVAADSARPIVVLTDDALTDSARQGALGWLSQTGPLSYLIAAAIMCLILLGAWAYKISHYQQMVDKQSPSISKPEMQFVGQVTGMADCRWSDPRTETYAGAAVSLGRKYALSSGLMEITYKSGAKVILQGPCTYEVESRAGGFLSLGKLTARIGERGERRGERAKPQATNPKSPNHQITKSPNHQIPSSFIPHPSSLFSVRTPTAIVTDLGTEFGVEVKHGTGTEVYVFRGRVEAEWIGQVGAAGQMVQLIEGKAARFDGRRVEVTMFDAQSKKFTRFIAAPPQRLVDVAANKSIVKCSGVYRSGNPIRHSGDWSIVERFSVRNVNNGVTDETLEAHEGGGVYWLGRERITNEYFIIYLRGRFDIERIELMNTHNGHANDRGTKDFEIWAADEVDGDTELVAPRLILKGALPCRFGAGPKIPFDVFSAAAGDFSRFSARYIKFVAKTYYEGERLGGCGLNEIKMFAAPAAARNEQWEVSHAAKTNKETR